MDDNADAKRFLLASPPANWRRQPTSHGSAPSNRIWNNTTLHSPKQQIWLRTALCGGWCRRMLLRNLRAACQKRRRRHSGPVDISWSTVTSTVSTPCWILAFSFLSKYCISQWIFFSSLFLPLIICLFTVCVSLPCHATACTTIMHTYCHYGQACICNVM